MTDIYEALEYVRQTDLEWAPKMVEQQRQADAARQQAALAEADRQRIADPMLMARLVPDSQAEEQAEPTPPPVQAPATSSFWSGMLTGTLMTAIVALLVAVLIWRII